MKPAVNPPPQVLELMHRLEQAGESCWVVGGCVRDSLMGRTPGDWDMTTSALPQRMLELFADHRLVTAGLCHGTVGVVQDGSLYEITTYRLESGCSDHRHPDSVRFTAEIRQDLARRDLTVNAMAWHPQRGLLDCFDGRQDLSRRLIRCVGDSERRFEEDALRILRAVRFASTLDFFLEEQTLSAACKQAPLLRRISAERIWIELRKLLEGPAALRVLEQAQPVLSQILPELANIQLQAGFSSLPPDAVLRLSWLCLQARAEPEAVLRRLRCSNADCRRAHALAEVAKQSPDTVLGLRTALRDFGIDAVQDWLSLIRAEDETRANDLCGALAVAQQGCWKRSELQIDGKQLLALGCPRGKELGNLLEELFELCLQDRLENRPQALRQKASQLLEQRKGEKR